MPSEYEECLAYITATDAREAFATVVEAAASSESVDVRPYSHGFMRDMSFFVDGSRHFSIVPARKWALFYFRHPGITHPALTLKVAEEVSGNAEFDSRNQFKVRLTEKKHAISLLKLLGWQSGQGKTDIVYADEVSGDEHFLEGRGKQVVVNAYERSATARRLCIRHYGCRCAVCDVSFEERYGEIGRGYIHVHHQTTVASNQGKQYVVDPIRDLRPVCPNCHAMLHQTNPPLTIEALKRRLTPRSS
jgi:predicted HNH restriction endonuclease